MNVTNEVDEKCVKYILRLHVTGLTPRAQDAIRNIERICEGELHGWYELEVVDIYQQPELDKKEQILALSTLMRKLPLPLRELVEGMSDRGKVIIGLEIMLGKKKAEEGKK